MALKRALGTLTAIVLTASLAVGCGKAETAPQEAQNAPAETQEQAEEAVPEAEAGQEAAEGTENGDAETQLVISRAACCCPGHFSIGYNLNFRK